MRKFQIVDQTRLNRFKISDNPLFKSVFEDSQEALFFLDPESFNILDCNKKAIELFQAENKLQLINLSLYSLYSNEPVEFSKKLIIEEIINGKEYVQELSLKSLQNNSFWGRISQKTIETEAGKIILLRINKVIEYIKASELLDKLIKQTSKVTGPAFFTVLSKLLTDTFEVKFVMIARVVDEEKNLAETVEFSQHNIKCKNFTFNLFNCPNTNVLNGYVSFYPSKLKDLFPDFSVFNELQVESYLGAPIFSKDGKIIGILALMDEKPMYEKPNARHILSIFASRTGAELERMDAEGKLKWNSEELLKINQSKDRLLQILAHDLKSPFNIILGYSELLKNKIKEYDKEKILEIVKIIDHSSKNCFALLESLTEWSMSQNTILHPQLKKINLFEIFEKVIDLYSYTAEKKNIAILNLIDLHTEIIADPLMLLTIFRNLVSNAIKFSYNDSRIEISSTLKDNETKICIEDFGTGMTEEKIQTIFALKHDSMPGTDEEKGSGLGMIVCKEFVQSHKGEIWIESKPNSGTKVFFTIPSLS